MNTQDALRLARQHGDELLREGERRARGRAASGRPARSQRRPARAVRRRAGSLLVSAGVRLLGPADATATSLLPARASCSVLAEASWPRAL